MYDFLKKIFFVTLNKWVMYHRWCGRLYAVKLTVRSITLCFLTRALHVKHQFPMFTLTYPFRFNVQSFRPKFGWQKYVVFAKGNEVSDSHAKCRRLESPGVGGGLYSKQKTASLLGDLWHLPILLSDHCSVFDNSWNTIKLYVKLLIEICCPIILYTLCPRRGHPESS